MPRYFSLSSQPMEECTKAGFLYTGTQEGDGTEGGLETVGTRQGRERPWVCRADTAAALSSSTRTADERLAGVSH